MFLTSFESFELRELIKEAVREVYLEKAIKEPEKSGYATRKEIAATLDISLPTLNKYTKTGKVVGYRVGGKVLYKIEEIEQCLKKIATRP